MFTKRHEQELAEIKTLTLELGQRFQEVLKELESIKKAQDQLAARNQAATAGKGAAGASAEPRTAPPSPARSARGAEDRPLP